MTVVIAEAENVAAKVLRKDELIAGQNWGKVCFCLEQLGDVGAHGNAGQTSPLLLPHHA